jgi:stage V sporulation protein AE
MDKRKVILVTDGDMAAKNAVETATANIGGRCISASAGNPTILTGQELIIKIKEAAHDPVVVMVDDRGTKGEGPGEAAMAAILDSRDLDVLGVVAVSSNGKDCKGINVSCSITKDGDVVHSAVDKYGEDTRSDDICGDTLSILRSRGNMFIVGMGDPGKMDYKDEVSRGAPITTKALKIIMEHSGLM